MTNAAMMNLEAVSSIVNTHPRDPETGRYVHEWGVIGSHIDTGEVAECQNCGKVWVYGDGGPDRYYKNRDAASRRGVALFEGYGEE